MSVLYVKINDKLVGIPSIKGEKGDKGDQGEPGSEEEIRTIAAEEIAKVVAEAPEDLDTLKEIADWINAHAEDAAAMNTQITENKNKIAAMGTVFTYKGSVATADDLPTASEEKNGWVYRVHATAEDYVCEYDSTDEAYEWTEMGSHIDLSGYATKDDLDDYALKTSLDNYIPKGITASGTLASGSTSITLTSDDITADSLIDVYIYGDAETAIPNVAYNTITVATGSVTITFDAQDSAYIVGVRAS